MTEPSPQDQMARMITGYWTSQAIYVAARLGIADLLVEGPRTADQLAQATGTHARSLYRLLRALASVGVFSEGEGGRFSLTPLAEPLRADVPGSQRATVLMMVGQFYHAWGELIGSVRTGRPAFEAIHGQRFFEFLGEHAEQAQVFDDAMTAFNDRKTRAVLEAYDFSGVSVLADIGGGNGSNLVSILRRHPEMRGILFDLPGVVERVEVREPDLEGRLQVVGGSFLEEVPGGADAYLLRHILHNWDDERAVEILGNVRRAMGEGAKLLVVERVIPPGNGPMFGKLMDLTMLVVHGVVERSEEEFRRLFEAAGFRLTRIIPTTSDASVIEGEGGQAG
jgi:O-methyltransferase domain/Dimerisation domain